MRGDDDLSLLLPRLGDKVLSLGYINGRNIWRTDLDQALAELRPLHAALGERLWLAPSCSLLHSPVDLQQEATLDEELKSWLSFATQKLDELALLGKALDDNASADPALQTQRDALRARANSSRIHRQAVTQRLAAAGELSRDRHSPFAERITTQQQALKLPAFPTTTIGSFPQTKEVRAKRAAFRKGILLKTVYLPPAWR